MRLALGAQSGQFRFNSVAFAAFRSLAQFALDYQGKPRKILLRDIIAGAGLHELDGAGLADHAQKR